MQRMPVGVRPSFAIGALSLLLLFVACASASETGPAGGGSDDSTVTPVQMATPSVPVLPGGERSDLAVASGSLSFAILVPDEAPATRDTLIDVWLDSSTNRVALEYAGGDVNIIEAPAAYSDATDYFRSILKDGGARESITSVQGFPALAIEGKTDAFSSNPAWLEVDFDGVDINIYSSVYTVGVLTQIGESLSSSRES
jgi:hypothetical protein